MHRDASPDAGIFCFPSGISLSSAVSSGTVFVKKTIAAARIRTSQSCPKIRSYGSQREVHEDDDVDYQDCDV
jgi:hypothetical protein